MFEEKSTRAGKHLPVKKPKILSQKYAAVYARKWREENPDACSQSRCKRPKIKGFSLCQFHRDKNYLVNRKQSERRKLRVLSHYGKGGKPQCRWRRCTVSDPDMLSIDHVENDGAAARKSGYEGCGSGLYRKIEREGFPEGFQTLCHNHQWKKEILRRKQTQQLNRETGRGKAWPRGNPNTPQES